jgi:hypothetical protein
MRGRRVNGLLAILRCKEDAMEQKYTIAAEGRRRRRRISCK